MTKKTEISASSGVDSSLIAIFLKMSPEDRLKSNDNAVRAILELRDAYEQQKAVKHRS